MRGRLTQNQPQVLDRSFLDRVSRLLQGGHSYPCASISLRWTAVPYLSSVTLYYFGICNYYFIIRADLIDLIVSLFTLEYFNTQYSESMLKLMMVAQH